MPILVDKRTKVVCQGFTGRQATIHSRRSIAQGTKIVGGVTPGKGGTQHLSLPVFDTVHEAIEHTGATATVVYVPAPLCRDAVLESIDSKIPLIVCPTEGVPILDMLIIKDKLKGTQTCMIGPNSPGIVTPNECHIGIMPRAIYAPGCVGIVSRSGTLTYEVIRQTTDMGFGQSSCVGIGGDYISGSGFVEILDLFEKDRATKAIVVIGEIGGVAEETAASHIPRRITKPVVGYIAGMSAPRNRCMGHAGAITDFGEKTAESKFSALHRAGVNMTRDFTKIGNILQKILKKSIP